MTRFATSRILRAARWVIIAALILVCAWNFGIYIATESAGKKNCLSLNVRLSKHSGGNWVFGDGGEIAASVSVEWCQVFSGIFDWRVGSTFKVGPLNLLNRRTILTTAEMNIDENEVRSFLISQDKSYHFDQYDLQALRGDLSYANILIELRQRRLGAWIGGVCAAAAFCLLGAWASFLRLSKRLHE